MNPLQESGDGPSGEQPWRGKKIVEPSQLEITRWLGLYHQTGSRHWAVAIRMVRAGRFRQNVPCTADEFLSRKYLLNASRYDKRPARTRVFMSGHLLTWRIRRLRHSPLTDGKRAIHQPMRNFQGSHFLEVIVHEKDLERLTPDSRLGFEART